MSRFVLCLLGGAVVASCGDLAEPIEEHAESPQVTGDTLILHFDETAGAASFKDTSASSRNAVCSGASCPTAGALGLKGGRSYARRAVDFDGSPSRCLTIPDHPGLELDAGAGRAFTISAWILPRELPAANRWRVVLSKADFAARQAEWMFGLRANSAGTTRVAFWKSAAGTGADGVYSSRRVVAPEDLDRWMHILVRVSSAGQWEIWIDGRKDSGGALANTSFFHGSAPGGVGCTASRDTYYKGRIDEVLIAKSYLSDADVVAQFKWSNPLPAIAPAAGLTPSQQDRPLDRAARDEIAARVRGLSAPAAVARPIYRFFLRRDSICRCRTKDAAGTCTGPTCADLNALRAFLSENPDIDVIVERNPIWYTINPSGASAECSSKTSPVAKWGCAIAEVARAHPNLVGWSIDDFFARHQDSAGAIDSFIDRSHAVEACEAIEDPATGRPSLPIYATLYCGHPLGKDGRTTFSDAELDRMYGTADWWRGSAVTPTDELAFDDYLNRPDASLRGCIKGVSVYTDPKGHTSHSAWINSCVSALRRPTLPGLKVIAGVYITSLGGANDPSDPRHLDCAERRANVLASRGANADGFATFIMPERSDTSCPGYEWLGALTRDPRSYIVW